MKTAAISLVLALLVAPFAALAQSASEEESLVAGADKLFAAGQFAEAAKVYSGVLAAHPETVPAVIGLGRVALLSNRLDEAERWFRQAIALRPDDADAKVMLAEALYRRDDFTGA